jgi:hypothetical protein
MHPFAPCEYEIGTQATSQTEAKVSLFVPLGFRSQGGAKKASDERHHNQTNQPGWDSISPSRNFSSLLCNTSEPRATRGHLITFIIRPGQAKSLIDTRISHPMLFTTHMTRALQNETNLAINQMEVSYSGMESKGGSRTVPIERKRNTFCHAGFAQCLHP